VRIGLIALGQGLGPSGGLQVYAAGLVEALLRYAPAEHRLVLLIGPDDEAPALSAGERASFVRLRFKEGVAEGPWARRFRRAAAALAPRLPRGPFSEQIDALGLDVVHCPSTRAEDLDLETPLVLTFFDMQEEFLPQFFSLRERLGRRASRRASLAHAREVIAPSAFTARCLSARGRGALPGLRVVPVGVSEAFSPEASVDAGARLRERYPLPAGPFALYPANVWRHKNHARLLAALALIRELSGAVIPLVCTGRLSSEGRGAVELARRAALPEGQVTDLGFVRGEDLPALYRAARLLVFPSLFEGFGIPVLEAMASGCPVACSETTSLPELGGDAVRYFDPRNEGSIAAALAELWSSESALESLAQRGLLRSRAFRWPEIVPALLSVYKAAAGPP
jgi:glycosyltransferase involved in cell wall biosynthesis